MKKYINIIIIILALMLMVLASSCRSPKTMTYSASASDSVKLSVKDSTAQRFSFTFDSLELWADLRNYGDSDLRTIQAQPSVVPKFRSSVIPYHAVIYGGKLTANITHDVSHDSIRNKSSTLSQHSVTPCYRSSAIPILLLGLILCLFIIYKLNKDRLS